MYLDEIVEAKNRGETKGITSVCSAHPWVLAAAMQKAKNPLLIEATCNQVNQLGGYTGLTPRKFVEYVSRIARENEFPHEKIILGGDHLGPSPWQNEPAKSAMEKAEVLIHDYVEAGFFKIHLDCSMPLADDPPAQLDVDVAARRAARLAKVAEGTPAGPNGPPRYIIGNEVPIPGGAHTHEENVSVTRVENAHQTIEMTRKAFFEGGLASAWDRVIALVVQPGIEFGDDFVLDYQPLAARDLSAFIQGQEMVYEAHSTDYQLGSALRQLVHDHFAILKVGPALTFAFREAIFALADIEKELIPLEDRSNIVDVIDRVMTDDPRHWAKYYHGTAQEQAFARKFSLSDRIRYYWQEPAIQSALQQLLGNLKSRIPLAFPLVSQYLPQQYEKLRGSLIKNTPEALILDKISGVLETYPQ